MSHLVQHVAPGQLAHVDHAHVDPTVRARSRGSRSSRPCPGGSRPPRPAAPARALEALRRPADQIDVLTIATEHADRSPTATGSRVSCGWSPVAVNACAIRARARSFVAMIVPMRAPWTSGPAARWRPLADRLEEGRAFEVPSGLQGARSRLRAMNRPSNRTSLPSRRNLSNRGSEPYGSRMRFKVLGPLQVDGSERARSPLGGPKQRAVLAHLLVRANELVPADTLIDQVWSGEPPEAARGTIHSYISHLRKALGADRIEGRPPGYVLHVGAGRARRRALRAAPARGPPREREPRRGRARSFAKRSRSGRVRPSPTSRPNRRSPARSRGSTSCVSRRSRSGSRPTSPRAGTAR